MKTEHKRRLILGYLLIILGISLPLASLSSMAYRQLTAASAYRAYAERPAAQGPAMEEAIGRYNRKISQTPPDYVDPFRMRAYKTDYDLDADPDGVFAYILIPSLEVSLPVRLGADEDHLAIGAAHVDGTALPVGAASSRSVIAAHRASHRETFFYNIDELRSGDPIVVDRGGQMLHYEVTGQEIVEYTQWERLQPVPGKDLLTLLTCMPFGLEPDKRLLVHARRASDPADQAAEDQDPDRPAGADSVQGEVRGQGIPEAAAVVPEVRLLRTGIYTVTLLGYGLLFGVIRSGVRSRRRSG